MRRLGGVLVLLLAALSTAACGSSEVNYGARGKPDEKPVHVEASATEELEAGTLEAVRPTIEALAAVVCTTPAKRMSADSEQYTDESWNCRHDDEDVRIDLFADADQARKANDVLVHFYRSSGDKRSLAELPLICGHLYSIGVDTNETRDDLIGKLRTAGFRASTC